jgi:hypothetical protein
MASFTISRKHGVRGDPARLSSHLPFHGWLLRLPITSVTAITAEQGSVGAPERVGVALSCGVEGILRRCLSPRLLKLSRLSATSFRRGCSGRISQGASESTAASTQRTWKYDGYSEEECSFEYPAWQDRSVTQTSSGVLIWRCKLQCHIHAVSTRRSLTGEPIYRHDRYREKPFSMRFST